jgi:hypothetical protein
VAALRQLLTHTNTVVLGSIARDALGVQLGFFNTLTPYRQFRRPFLALQAKKLVENSEFTPTWA